LGKVCEKERKGNYKIKILIIFLPDACIGAACMAQDGGGMRE
jgi:hypothetical protein